LNGWALDVKGDAKIGLEVSSEEIIWHDTCAKLTYSGGVTKNQNLVLDQTTSRVISSSVSGNATIAILKPPKPVSLEAFDTVNFWIYGGWYRISQKSTPPKVTLNMKDNSGLDFQLPLGMVNSGCWNIESAFVDDSLSARIRFPVTLESITFSDLDIDGSSRMFLDSITFYNQKRTPGRYAIKAADRIAPRRADRGMLPPIPTGVQTFFSKANERGRFELKCKKGELDVIYGINLQEGVLNGLSCRIGKNPEFKIMAEGKLEFNVSDSVRAATVGTLVSFEQKDRSIVAEWSDNTQPLQHWKARYSLSGLTLIVDISSDNQATGLKYGKLKVNSEWQTIFVPYLVLNRISHLSSDGPLLACGNGAFISILPDIYHCNFSTFVNAPDVSKDGIGLCTGTKYFPLSDGNYNQFRERVIITVSDDFLDVLPDCPNPPSSNISELSSYMHFRSLFLAESFFSILKRYGIDKILAKHFNTYSSSVKHGYDSFGVRYYTRKDLPMERFQEYIKVIKKLGYKFGTYSYFADLQPINEFWRDDRIQLKTTKGKVWNKGWWYASYSMKMCAAAELVDVTHEKISKLYSPDFTYLDIHSVMGPHAVDYEAGEPGAGMARAAIEDNIEVMARVSRNNKAVCGEGYHRWLYAGYSDMDYASLLHPVKYKTSSELPLMLDFNLFRIHTRQIGVGMGFDPVMFLAEKERSELLVDEGVGDAPEGFYKWIAAALAYGHMAMLGHDYVPPLSRIMQMYFLMIAPQEEYLPVAVREIRYHDGKKFQTTSQALLSGGLGQNWVQVTYQSGLQVQVNYNARQNWQIDYGGKTYILPPYGWLITKAGKPVSMSVLQDGERLDVAENADYLYVRSDKKVTVYGPVQLRGAVLIKKQQSVLRIVPCGDLGPWEKFLPDGLPTEHIDRRLAGLSKNGNFGDIVIDTMVLLNTPAGHVTTHCFSQDGKKTSAETAVNSKGALVLKPKGTIVDFEITAQK